jgi:hypothetical protein
MACCDIWNGCASSVTDAGPVFNLAKMARLVGSDRADIVTLSASTTV